MHQTAIGHNREIDIYKRIALNYTNNKLKCATYTLVIDFKTVFDSINPCLWWQKLFHVGVSAKLVRILKSLYDCATAQVREGDILSDEFEIMEVVLQG